MPYSGEFASKASHYDIIRNPDVSAFLDECDYLTPPSEEEATRMAARFQVPPPTDPAALPQYIIAIDGSRHESSIDDRLPSTKVGYVKVGCVLIDMGQYQSLRVGDGRLVDPFRVARLQESNSPLTFTLPSANVRWQGKTSVRDGFRAAVDAQLYGPATRFNPTDPRTSLRTTLFHLAACRPGRMGTQDPARLRIHRCPSCSAEDVEVHDVPDQQHCPSCGAEVYPSDCLRLWEEVTEYQSNVEALSRFMLQVEHLLPIHYVRYLADHSPAVLGNLAFFIDGPLAVFGNGAWLHGAIMRYLGGLNERLRRDGQPPLLMIGLQKSGQVVDYVRLIERFLPPNRILAIDDKYRYQYILSGRDPSANGFGAETYYGQDFIFKTPSGRSFVFAVPYPFASKDEPGVNFVEAKTDLGRYANLSRALALIHTFETDLYGNAVVPIALAHRFTAISLVPGGQVLDLLTRSSLP